MSIAYKCCTDTNTERPGLGHRRAEPQPGLSQAAATPAAFPAGNGRNKQYGLVGAPLGAPLSNKEARAGPDTLCQRGCKGTILPIIAITPPAGSNSGHKKRSTRGRGGGQPHCTGGALGDVSGSCQWHDWFLGQVLVWEGVTPLPHYNCCPNAPRVRFRSS